MLNTSTIFTQGTRWFTFCTYFTALFHLEYVNYLVEPFLGCVVKQKQVIFKCDLNKFFQNESSWLKTLKKVYLVFQNIFLISSGAK